MVPGTKQNRENPQAAVLFGERSLQSSMESSCRRDHDCAQEDDVDNELDEKVGQRKVKLESAEGKLESAAVVAIE